MAVTEARWVSLKVPGEYLDDLRAAAAAEVISGTEFLRTGDEVDRENNTRMLCRDMEMLDALRAARGKAEVRSQLDSLSCPLTQALQTMIRQQIEHLQAAAQYGPIPMDQVLDLTKRVRWAATESVRIMPALSAGRAVA